MSALRPLIAACAVLHAQAAAGAVLYSTLGPGIGFDRFVGVELAGPSAATPQALAERFTPAASASLDSVELALSTSVGAAQLNVRIFADSAGVPGDLLEETPLVGFGSGLATAAFSGQLTLNGGTDYWLGAFAASANRQSWHDSTSPSFGLQAFSADDGATWAALSSDPFPRAAFRVHGTTVAPPEVSLIAERAAWRYFRGLAEPSVGTQWTTSAFNDAAWDFGPEGFGYDTDAATQAGLLAAVRTPLADMREDGVNPNAYTVVYLRRTFDVTDPAALSELVLSLDYDDSFIAYVNGVEIVRSPFGSPGAPEPFDALGVDHESTNGAPGVALPRFSVDLLNDFPGLLHPGTDNVLAIQGLNVTLNDSDFVLSRISLGANAAVAYSADFDADGDVDGADLARWRSGFGATSGATAAQGDVDGDGRVDGDDFLVWQRQFDGTGSNAPAASVPELAAFRLAFACVATLATRLLTRGSFTCRTALRHPSSIANAYNDPSSATGPRDATIATVTRSPGLLQPMVRPLFV